MTTREKRIFWVTVGIGGVICLLEFFYIWAAQDSWAPVGLVIVLIICQLLATLVVGRILVIVGRRYPLRKVLPLAALWLVGAGAVGNVTTGRHNWVRYMVLAMVMYGCIGLTVQLFTWLNPDIQPKKKPPVLLTGGRRRLALGAAVVLLVVDLFLISVYWAYGSRPCQRLDLLRRIDGCRMLLAVQRGVVGLSYATNGTMLAATAFPDKVYLWSLPEGQRLLSDTLSADVHIYEQSAALSQDGALIALDVGRTSVEVRRTSNGTMMHRLPIPDGEIRYISFSPDGTLLGVISRDAIRVWRMADLALLYTLPGPERALFFSPDGDLLFISAYEEVQVHNALDGSRVRDIPVRRSPHDMALSADATILASAHMYDDQASVELRRVSNGELIWSLSGSNQEFLFSAIALSPDGTLLLTAGSFSSEHDPVTLWRVADGVPVQSFDIPDRVETVAFAPDGRSIAIAVYDGVFIWEIDEQ